ncbi:hypothetical protein Tco_0210620 [Tanacetum coccineum]
MLPQLLNDQQSNVSQQTSSPNCSSGRQTTYAAGTMRKYTPGASRKQHGETTDYSDCDELNSAKIALIANLSRNGSNALTEVHNLDNLTYDLINQSEQIMTSSDQSNDVNQTETEITSDRNIIPYLTQAIDHDIVKTVVNLSVNDGCKTVNECQKCLELKTELLNKKDFVDKETYDKLNACPLTRITTTNEVPSMQPIVLESESPNLWLNSMTPEPRKNKILIVLSDIEDSHGPSDAMHKPLPATQSQKDFVSKLTEIHSFLLTFSLRNIRVNSFTMKMEILLEPTSNKLMVEHAEYDESNTYVLERFNTTAGNPVKKILLKLNLSDHSFKVKEVQRSFRHSDTELLSRSDEVLKLKNFKKDATLKLSKSTNQESSRNKLNPEINDHYNIFTECQKDELKTQDKALYARLKDL